MTLSKVQADLLANVAKLPRPLKSIRSIWALCPGFHFCPDWDYLPICDDSPERCTCTVRPPAKIMAGELEAELDDAGRSNFMIPLTPYEARQLVNMAKGMATGNGSLGEAHSYERQEAWAALRMVRDAVETLFGPAADLPSEESVLTTRGPEFQHEARAIVDGLARVGNHWGALLGDERELRTTKKDRDDT